MKRAIELNPNTADAHEEYSAYLAAMGGFEEGLAHAKRAVELDPLTPTRRAAIGVTYYSPASSTKRSALTRRRWSLRQSRFQPEPRLIYQEKEIYRTGHREYQRAWKAIPAVRIGSSGERYARAGRGRKLESGCGGEERRTSRRSAAMRMRSYTQRSVKGSTPSMAGEGLRRA